MGKKPILQKQLEEEHRNFASGASAFLHHYGEITPETICEFLDIKKEAGWRLHLSKVWTRVNGR